MKEIKCFLVGLCVIFTGVIQAQTGAISGVVVDERGKEYRLLDRQNPRLLGDDMAFIHPVGAV